jgi:rhodanese-related sulfurtransferase
VKLVREVLVLLAVAAFPAGLAIALHPELADRSRAGLESGAVRVADTAAWGDSVLWLDARDPAAHVRGHIPGALLFDEGAFSESLGAVITAWTPERRIVIYCDSTACSRARDVAQQLREAGFDGVYFLHGGWEAWSAAQRP